MSITMALEVTSADWRQGLSGWQCDALRIPGASATAVFVEGTRHGSEAFGVLKEHAIVQWNKGAPPPRATVEVTLTRRLVTMRMLGLLLPFVGTLLTIAATLYLGAGDRSPINVKSAGRIVVLDSDSRRDAVGQLTTLLKNDDGLDVDPVFAAATWEQSVRKVADGHPRLVIVHLHALREQSKGASDIERDLVAEETLVVGLGRLAEESPRTRFLIYSAQPGATSSGSAGIEKDLRAAAERVVKESPRLASKTRRLLAQSATVYWGNSSTAGQRQDLIDFVKILAN